DEAPEGQVSESAAARWTRRLRTGEGVSNDWSGVMTIVNGLVAAGFENTFIREAMLEPANAGARHVNFTSTGAMRPTAARERHVRSAIKRARDAQRRSGPMRDRAEVVATCAAIRDDVADRPEQWRGMAGGTDHAVVLAIVSMAERFGRLDVGCSY